MPLSCDYAVGRRGLEPRTRGLKDVPWAVRDDPQGATLAGQRVGRVPTRPPGYGRIRWRGCHRGCQRYSRDGLPARRSARAAISKRNAVRPWTRAAAESGVLLVSVASHRPGPAQPSSQKGLPRLCCCTKVGFRAAKRVSVRKHLNPRPLVNAQPLKAACVAEAVTVMSRPTDRRQLWSRGQTGNVWSMASR